MDNITKQKKAGRFLQIICPRCRERKIVYGKSSTKIKCDHCNKVLIKTTGGKTKIKAMIREIM